VAKFLIHNAFRHCDSEEQTDLPIMIARPFGSTARYCPGTIRRQPLFPNVSWWTWYEEKQTN